MWLIANVAKKQSNVGIRRHYNLNDHAITFDKVDDVMNFKHLSFLFQKKRLEVNVGEK